jgi:hypothetical protein
LGENQKNLQIIYQGEHSAKWYLTNFAGGLMPKADKSSILVIRQNGLVKGTRKVFGIFKKYPKVHYGDLISVSYKIEEPVEEKKDNGNRAKSQTNDLREDRGSNDKRRGGSLKHRNHKDKDKRKRGKNVSLKSKRN